MVTTISNNSQGAKRNNGALLANDCGSVADSSTSLRTRTLTPRVSSPPTRNIDDGITGRGSAGINRATRTSADARFRATAELCCAACSSAANSDASPQARSSERPQGMMSSAALLVRNIARFKLSLAAR